MDDSRDDMERKQSDIKEQQERLLGKRQLFGSKRLVTIFLGWRETWIFVLLNIKPNRKRNIRCLLRPSWPRTRTLVTVANISTLNKTNYKARHVITWGERKCSLVGEIKKSYDKGIYVEFQYRKVMKHWEQRFNLSYHLKELNVLLKAQELWQLKYKISSS